MYALVDKEQNLCWGFFRKAETAKEALNKQEDPANYRIEKVDIDDFIDINGNIYNKQYKAG